jgi:hypothetical protein
MKIPKQSKPVRRAGFINRLKIKGASNVMPSMIEDEPEDIPGVEDEGDTGDTDEAGEEVGEEAYEGTDEVVGE